MSLLRRPLAVALVASLSLAGCALTVTRLNSAQKKPNNVWVFFTVEKGDEPVAGLQAEDFQIYEDDELVSVYESKQVIQNPEVAAVMYTMLLLDVSGSITESGSAAGGGARTGAGAAAAGTSAAGVESTRGVDSTFASRSVAASVVRASAGRLPVRSNPPSCPAAYPPTPTTFSAVAQPQERPRFSAERLAAAGFTLGRGVRMVTAPGM